MTNETDNIIESQNNEQELDLELVEETQEEAQPKETIEKPVETPEAKLARLKRQTAQLEKKLGVKEVVKEEVKQEPKSQSSDFGYAEKAFLLANDIKADEISLAKDIMKKTGLNLDELVSDDYFKAKLKTFREEKASSEAVPRGAKRSSPSPRDSVDYWLKKPFDEVPSDMRAAVVNARLEKEKSKNPFS